MERGAQDTILMKKTIKFVTLFDNKFIFKTLAAGFGLPQPKFISAFGKAYEIQTKERFLSLMNSIDYDFVVKPIWGSSGRGIRVLEYREGNFFCANKQWDREDLWNLLVSDEHLMEEKISQIDDFSNIYPLSINTFRIIMVKTDDNAWQIVRRHLRVGCKGRQIDSGGICVR